MDSRRALTIRLPENIYRVASKLAQRRGVSINRLIQEAIVQQAEKSMEGRLMAAYDMLAEEDETYGVDDLLAVQVETLLDG